MIGNFVPVGLQAVINVILKPWEDIMIFVYRILEYVIAIYSKMLK